MPSEKATRASLIDRQLQLASWAVDDPTHPNGLRGIFASNRIHEILAFTGKLAA